MGTLTLLGLVVVIVMLNRLARRVTALEGQEVARDVRIIRLEGAVARLVGRTPRAEPDAVETPAGEPGLPARAPRPVAEPAVAASFAPTPSIAPPPRTVHAPRPPDLLPVPPAEPIFGERWQQVERQLVENWTGILGSIVLVAGLTFIGGYAALRVSPFARTLIIVAAAALLGAGSVALAGRERWQQLAGWLRSSGAAVFLFACFASSGIPGLRWVTAFAPALAILLLGVTLNLGVAWVARTAAFASLHVVLSLVPLLLVPQSTLTLVLATAVSGVGLALGWRHRWDVHTLLTLLATAAFHLGWYARVLAPAPDLTHRLAGAAGALLVAGLVVAGHYRATYAAARVATVPFTVHLLGWAFLAAALGAYTGNTPARGATLLVAAVAVYVLARRGRALGVRWVYLTDTLVAQTLALLGVVAFYPFVLHWLLVPAAALVLAALYLKLAVDEDEALLARIAAHLLHAAFAVLTFGGLTTLGADRATRDQTTVVLLTAVLVGLALHRHLLRRRSETFESLALYGQELGPEDTWSLAAIGCGLLTTAALANLIGSPWLAPAGFATSASLVLLARRWTSGGLTVAAWLVLLVAHLLAWSTLMVRHPVPPVEQLVRFLLPLAAAAAVAIRLAGAEGIGRTLGRGAITLLGLTAALAAWTLLQPLSSLAPGVAWLSLSLVALEVANRTGGDRTAPTLHLGYLYLALFAAAYALVVLQAQERWGAVPVRALIEGFALLVLAYWWWFRPQPGLGELRSWLAVHPLLVELALTFIAVVVLVEVAAPWRPAVWMALALVAAAPRLARALDRRLNWYSVLFYWVAILDLVLVTSDRWSAPSATWSTHPGVTGTLGILLQVAYLAVAAPRLDLGTIAFPPSLSGLGTAARAVAARQPLWLYYPFFLGVALFLYWRFEAAVLTLLWSTEAFVVFALSLVLRENHFRYMALAGIAACLARLVFFDMVQTNLGLRGLAFVGVGALMLGMNSLYNRFKDRYA